MAVSPFPIPRHMAESSEPYDFVEVCLLDYDAFLEAGYGRAALPIPIERVKEAYTFVLLLLNGGNGFAKYEMDEGWTPNRLATALEGLRSLGLGDTADILAPYVARLNQKPGLLRSRKSQLEEVFSAFAEGDFGIVERAWLAFPFNRAAHDFLRSNLDFEILENDAYLARKDDILRSAP